MVPFPTRLEGFKDGTSTSSLIRHHNAHNQITSQLVPLLFSFPEQLTAVDSSLMTRLGSICTCDRIVSLQIQLFKDRLVNKEAGNEFEYVLLTRWIRKKQKKGKFLHLMLSIK